MSEPTRYDYEQAELNKSAGFYVRKEGHWVKWEDYQRLDALCKQLMAQHSDISCENIRLRKAGDAMCKFFDDHGFYGFGFQEAWNAAKEGKQP